MSKSLQEIEIIVHGEVQGVGYRQYVAKIGRQLNLVGCVKNLEDGTVQIRCKGEEKKINDFKEQINVKKPEKAPLIEVEKITSDKPLEQGTIKQTTFQVIHGDPNNEIFEGNVAGINYLNLFREDTNANFVHMNEKYHIISQSMLAVVDEIRETNKLFESRIEKIVTSNEETNKLFERRMEKTEKSIESLLKILTAK